METSQIAEDILIAAIEGGSNYWIDCIQFVTGADNYVLKYNEGIDRWKHGRARLIITETEESDFVAHEVSVEEFVKGCKLTAIDQGLVLDDFHDKHDGNDADCALQYAALGEITYG